jgi:hypothetical protein
MEAIALTSMCLVFGVIGYFVGKRDITEVVEAKPELDKDKEAELIRLRKREEAFQKLMNYNEDIATRGYRE